ncbi:MAG: hypothetical protein G01um101416_678 [Microgenomates group bacterium Gr01-1014_16]|nr:MAG: hypothetical protein G01um101416_678 [Microgenomates group bacterium Gr01-1014_16]
MNALTVRPNDDLYKRLVAEAQGRELSLNRVALDWMKEGSGLARKRRDLSGLGEIPKKEWDRIEKRIEEAFEVVDEDE